MRPTHAQRIQNQEESLFLQLPFELLRLVVADIDDPIDLLHLSHVSSFLLKEAIVPKDWFRLYRSQLPTWSRGIQPHDLPDLVVQDISGIKLHLCAWKRHTVREARFRKRNSLLLPPSAPSGNSTNTFTPAATDVATTIATAVEAHDPPEIVLHHAAQNTDVASTQHSNLPEQQGEARLDLPSLQGGVTTPTPSLTSSTTTTINASTAAVVTASRDVTFVNNPPIPMTKVWVPLGEARSYPSDPETTTSNFKLIGSPVYHADSVAKTTVAASIVARPLPLPDVVPVHQSYEHKLLLYSFPELTKPIAICESKLWYESAKSAMPWNHAPQVTQVVDIKHYPRCRNADNRMRVLVLLAFGNNAGPLAQEGGDLHILDIWNLVLAIELWIPDSATSDSIYTIQELGQVGLVRPTTRTHVFRGRIANLYTAPDPVTQEPLDCLALFGIQHSADSRAIIIKSILFQDEALYPLRKKNLGKNVSCMATFPSNSGYERLLVIFNRLGRGMIWDWVNDMQVAQLHLPQDGIRRTEHPGEQGSTESSTVGGTQTQAGQSIQSTGSTQLSVQGTLSQTSENSELYFWGVQVNWAIELPHTLPIEPAQRKSFRIVILADGIVNEWKACWWHVDSDMLGISEVDLKAPAPSLTNATSTNEPLQIWYATSTRFENESLGLCRNGQNPEPLLFIAFVIWNRYMIGLTSRLGVTMLAMEEGPSSSGVDRQWASFLEDSENNPLVDVATVGESLVITRRHGHLIWFFYT
ncbi:hypothetical protein BG006_009767 [Podila minutissima]|uniref:F-box domain-containing protein n=1 Tax=Podila minutissima TaxID=64525 RepID=A0A9P5ST91_9FUNG|nr:hypothetical protein BG006_009767 [Podila minutissima]